LLAGRETLPDDLNGRLMWWAGVRPIALEAGAMLDPYLDTEGDVVAVDAIQPAFQALPDGGLRVNPAAEGLDTDQFQRLVGDDEVPLATYSERLVDGGRRRYVFSDRAQEGLGQVLRKRSYDAAEAAEVLERPHLYFDPNLFDLSPYSDRVIGIGPARYRANRVFVAPPPSDAEDEEISPPGWTPDAPPEVYLELVDDHCPEAEPVLVAVSRDEDRQEALEATKTAIANDQAMAWIDGRPVRASAELVAMLEDLPSVETGSSPRETPVDLSHVLLIHENEESVDFNESAGGVVPVPADWQPQRPESLKPSFTLYPYQEAGFRWLTWRQTDAASPRGGLLADDMGLGKTLQVLCMLARRAEEGRLRPSLIVAPVSLLKNWEQEARRFIPAAVPSIVDVRNVPRGAEASLANFDLVLTSYETLAARDVELGRIPWQAVVCDEAQKIKNPSTRAAHAVKAMRAEVRVAMTGTPVENSLDDLWSLVDFFGPGLLGSLKEFRDRYSSRRVDAEEAASSLRARLEPVVLRRLKEDLLHDLPPVQPVDHDCEMSDLQSLLYRRMQHAAAHGDSAARLAAIQRLLQICAHPFLVSSGSRDGLDPVEACPKLRLLLEALGEVQARGQKALVFARWIDLQWLLADTIQSRLGVRVEVLNGAVPSARRQPVIDAFSASKGFGVLVLAPRACGVGLNITAANHVFHYTREWNPAVEAQATDRVHRIGQKEPVFVHFFESTIGGERTADAALARILKRKRGLIRDFVQPMADRRVRLSDFNATELEVPDEAPSPSPIGLIDPAVLLARLERLPVAEVSAGGRFLAGGAGLILPTRSGWAALVDRPKACLDALGSMTGRGTIYLRTRAGFFPARRLRALGEVHLPVEVERRVGGAIDELMASAGVETLEEDLFEPLVVEETTPLPEWLVPVSDEGHRRALLHLSEFGHMTEAEALRLMGNPRALRRFARSLEHYVELAPFGLRVETGASGKMWVKE